MVLSREPAFGRYRAPERLGYAFEAPPMRYIGTRVAHGRAGDEAWPEIHRAGSAIVADRRPLERGLARFLLEERGLFVVGRSGDDGGCPAPGPATPSRTSSSCTRSWREDHDPSVIAQIRRVSPADEHRPARGEPGVARARAAPAGRYRGGGWPGPHGARSSDRWAGRPRWRRLPPASRISPPNRSRTSGRTFLRPPGDGSIVSKGSPLRRSSVSPSSSPETQRNRSSRNRHRCISMRPWHRSTISKRPRMRG